MMKHFDNEMIGINWWWWLCGHIFLSFFLRTLVHPKPLSCQYVVSSDAQRKSGSLIGRSNNCYYWLCRLHFWI